MCESFDCASPLEIPNGFEQTVGAEADSAGPLTFYSKNLTSNIYSKNLTSNIYSTASQSTFYRKGWL